MSANDNGNNVVKISNFRNQFGSNKVTTSDRNAKIVPFESTQRGYRGDTVLLGIQLCDFEVQVEEGETPDLDRVRVSVNDITDGQKTYLIGRIAGTRRILEAFSAAVQLALQAHDTEKEERTS